MAVARPYENIPGGGRDGHRRVPVVNNVPLHGYENTGGRPAVRNHAYVGGGAAPAQGHAAHTKYENTARPRAASAAAYPPHLRLGLTRKGVIMALERIRFTYRYKFAQARVENQGQGKLVLEPDHDSGNQFDVDSDFEGKYQRPEDELGWVTEQYGRHRSTGYDVVEATKQYLRKSGNSGYSLCEVLSADRNPEVGKADVFLSHVQSAHIGELLGTMKAAIDAFQECSENTKFWVDFFTLRQCQEHAFEPAEMVGVIRDIGVTVVELDGDFVGNLDVGGGNVVHAGAAPCTYLSRTFCIFEVYATLKAKGKVLCIPKSVVGLEWDRDRWAALLKLSEKVNGIDCRTATSRNAKHKRQIERYVETNIGFDSLNNLVRKAILQSADRCRPDLFGDKYRRADGTTRLPEWTEVLDKHGITPHRPPARPEKSDSVLQRTRAESVYVLALSARPRASQRWASPWAYLAWQHRATACSCGRPVALGFCPIGSRCMRVRACELAPMRRGTRGPHLNMPFAEDKEPARGGYQALAPDADEGPARGGYQTMAPGDGFLEAGEAPWDGSGDGDDGGYGDLDPDSAVDEGTNQFDGFGLDTGAGEAPSAGGAEGAAGYQPLEPGSAAYENLEPGYGYLESPRNGAAEAPEPDAEGAAGHQLLETGSAAYENLEPGSYVEPHSDSAAEAPEPDDEECETWVP